MRRCLVILFALLPTFPLAAQTLPKGLREQLRRLVETPGIAGREGGLAAEIGAELKPLHPQTDSLGNVCVTLGSGTPHRVLVTPVDEPGYVVSDITADGYLRVQRLPQLAPYPIFDQLYEAQPVRIGTRRGKWLSGVVAGLSVHLQPGRANPPVVDHPDQMFIDIGARSAAEARAAGADLLDPVALERRFFEMGYSKATAPAIGDRFGAATLLELARRVDAGKLRGRLTVAFVTQQWTGARGLVRLLEELKPDEIVYVGRMLPRRRLPAGAASEASPAATLPPREPERLLGSGVLIGASDPEAAPSGLAAEILQLGAANRIAMATDFSAGVLPQSYLPPPQLPERFVHLGIATAWPSTPAELIDCGDLLQLARLLEAYLQLPAAPTQGRNAAEGRGEQKARAKSQPQLAPSARAILSDLVETYGVSGHEAAVREEVARLLPPWAKPVTDAAGNLILHWGASAGRSKPPRLLFVAHTDEIGFEVQSIAADGRLELRWRGRGNIHYFAGHAALVHTAKETLPGVLEIPAGWLQPEFKWPRGLSSYRVDVGARSKSEAEQLGIQPGDWVTIPKKFRALAGTRASGRSFDDRVGCTALIAAAWALGPALPGREVTFAWSTREELGLEGAAALAARLAAEGHEPDYVFAIDTFVSSDSPLESKRFGDALVGSGFVVRAVDNSNLVPLPLVDRVVELARAGNIPVQYGVTGGGNDGSAFLRYGAVDVALGWPLRYSHSPAEEVDIRDVESLAKIVSELARRW